MTMSFQSLLITLFTINNLAIIYGQDIVGCGGFVQSSVPIKFEKVEVRLHTKQGSFKFKTECAPNNGYFLVAIYDKGEYILQINPPSGWGFAPQQIPLNIDGVDDPCSKGKDLNFVFTGFSVIGKIVSLGKEQGPSGVTVKILGTDGTEVTSNTTNEVGSFIFQNVMPGQYTLKASHATWAFRNDEVAFNVTDDNTEITERLEIAGYDVKGHVLSSGEPIQGVSFILYSVDGEKKDMVQSCTDQISSEIVISITIEDAKNALCVVKSEKDGSFSFPTIPSGNYVLVPFYSAQNIVFDIVPSKLSFSVNYKSVILKTPFQVYGFSVQGRIVDTMRNGVSDVTIVAVSESGEQRTAFSKSEGRFLMENVTTGHYVFKVSKDHYFFEETKIHITPNTPNLQDLVAQEYSLCGTVHVPLLPPGVLQINQHKVLLQNEGEQQNTNIKTTTPDKNGNFCFKAAPGKYKLEIPVIESEKKVGFLLKPSEIMVEVINGPVLDLNFSQFLGTITGNVACMEKCSDVSVYMVPVDQQSSEKIHAKIETDQNGGTFTFPNVLPGKYKVSAQRKKWCWDPSSVEVEVKNDNVEDVKFSHSGYYLKTSVSHDITLNFTLDNSNETARSLELQKGTNQFCLKKPGTYSLTPISCYKFEKDIYPYNTAEPKSLDLNVQSYKLIIGVHTTKVVDDLLLLIRSKSTGIEEHITAAVVLQENPSEVYYEALYWGRLNGEFTVTPVSKEILFYPDKLAVTVQENCPGAVAKFEGREGKFIEGSVLPALSSVLIKIVTKASEKYASKSIEILSDEQGKFRVGPMHSDITYEVSASKEGYLITPQQDNPGNFIAQKLGFITVKVSDENDTSMGQVLLSLSGGQYRNNNLTGGNGVFTFSDLGPGQYFLRPMQKEYSFEPNSKMITVSEGEEVAVDVKGRRVAFSCSGVLQSLSGVAEENVGIEAVGLHKCSEFHEAALSDKNGFFRLRGLQPGCAYNIRMVKSDGSPIERLAPTNQVVNVQQEDIPNIKFIVFHKPTKFHLTARIETELDFLPTLKVILYEESNLESPVHTVSPGVVKYVQFPPLKPKTYVIKLQSTLSSKTHETHATSATVSPDNNLSKKHVKLKFEAKAKKVDLEPTQSVIALPLAVALVFLAYNYDAVLVFLLKLNSFIQTFNKGGESSEGESDLDDETKTSKKKSRR